MTWYCCMFCILLISSKGKERVTSQWRNLADTSSKWSMLMSVIKRQTDFRYLLMWFTEKDTVIRYSVLLTKAYNLNWIMRKQSDKPNWGILWKQLAYILQNDNITEETQNLKYFCRSQYWSRDINHIKIEVS